MKDLWDILQQTKKPIVLYGTGNGADKIIAELDHLHIPLSGVFASDGFVRERTFASFPVLSYQNARGRFGDMVVLLAFGSHRSDVIGHIREIGREQELYAPDMALYGQPVAFTKEYYESHIGEIEAVENLLADEKSREVFRDVLTYRLSGDLSWLFHCETEESENWKLLQLTDKEQYMDLGAYTGDTIDMFLSQVNGYDTIYAVEPDRRNFRKLSEHAKQLQECYLFDLGISDREETLLFSKGTGRGGTIGKGKEKHFTSVDRLLQGKAVTFMKMDVEGQEMKALLGAKKTIDTFHPKLLVSAYHRIDDLWTLPLTLHGWYPGYRFYLRHSPCVPAWEVNYYVISENKHELSV